MDYNKLIKVSDSAHGVQKGRRMLKRAKHVADAVGDKVNIYTDIEGVEVGMDDEHNRIIKTRDEKGNNHVIKVNKQNEVVNDGCCGGKKSPKKKPVKKVSDDFVDPFNFYPNDDESKKPTHRVNYYTYRGASTSSPAIFNSDEEAISTAKSEAKNRGRNALGVVVQRYKDNPNSKYSDLEEVYRDDPYNVVRDSAPSDAEVDALLKALNADGADVTKEQLKKAYASFKKDVRIIRLNDNCQTDRQAEFSISPEAIYGILTEGESSVKIPNNGMNVNEYAKSCIKVMQGIAKDCGNKLPSISYSIVGDEICFKTK